MCQRSAYKRVLPDQTVPSATIKIFLPYGDPKRLRTAELSNWSGKAVAGPRSEFDALLGREESDSSGVYILAGSDPESGKPALYVGEAENIRERIKAHLKTDFWNQVIFFISKDENLTKSHIRNLEGKLIEHAHTADRAVVKNNQNSGSKLPEADRADMDVFLEKIRQLLPVLGVELLVPLTSDPQDRDHPQILLCQIKGLTATGRLSPNGFVVFKASEAVLTERASVKKYPWPLNMRQKLKEDGVLVSSDEHLTFTRDAEFSSPSAAAAVVHGGHANGLIAWKDEAGKTLKEIEEV